MASRLASLPPVLPGLTYVRPLGSGGFADVFLYQQDMPRRAVAVKVLPADVRDPELVRMFNSEADVLAQLSSHPSIVTVYQAGISPDGRAYIVMEYCPGSLAQSYRRERMPVDQVLAIAVSLASALESAHRAGLIHRDVKPSNILVTSFGTVVLADFGISASLSREPVDELWAMSVPWSAPEVIAEATSGSVASEVWSLGATVYSLLAGHTPFERRERGQNTPDQLRRRIERAAYVDIPRSDVPASLQVVLATSMRRDPRQRFATASEFGEAIRGVQREQGLSVTSLQVGAAEWAPLPTSIDFSDAALRGPARSHLDQSGRRHRAPAASLRQLARDEDGTTVGAPVARRRVLGWVIAGVSVVAAVSAIIAVLNAGGVL